MDCEVCTESFNQISRKKVTCAGCQYTACRKCIETYFTSITYDHQCMKCNKLWDDEFVKSNFTQANIQRLKNHRENILFDREKLWMPSTQPHVLHNIYSENFTFLQRKIYYIRGVLRTLKSTHKQFQDDDALKDIHDLCAISIGTHQERLIEFETEFEALKKTNTNLTNNNNNNNNTTNRSNKYTSDIIFQCPSDVCRGFVGTDMKCSLCDTHMCKKCLGPRLSNDHECKQEDVLTSQLIRDSTKPCPKCATRIHRISGCTQMWCTQCNTSFDYLTGTIYKRNIHNPHYFEWLRLNPTVEEAATNEPTPLVVVNGCIELSSSQFLTHIRAHIYPPNQHASQKREQDLSTRDSLYNDLAKMVRSHYHIRHLMRTYSYVENENNMLLFNSNLDLRISWMRNKIDDKQFKRTLQKREKQFIVDLRKYQVLIMCADILHEMCTSVLNSRPSHYSEWGSYITRYTSIMTHGDDCLKQMGKLYKMKMPVMLTV